MLPTQHLTSFLFFRNIILPLLVVAELYFLPYWFVLATMIVGGQAHFFMAYLYQFRAGKMKRGYLMAAAVIAALIIFYYLVSGAFIPLYIAVSILFITHFAFDEFTLHDEKWTFSKVSSAVGLVVTFMTLVLHSVHPILIVLLSVLIINGIGIVIRLVRNAASVSPAEWYMWFLQALVILMVFGTIPIPMTSITSFIIILHFFNWMIGYGVKLRDLKKPRNRYWIETGVSFVGFGILYWLFYMVSEPLFALFFTVSAYYAWAIGHILLSAFLMKPRWG